MVVAPLMVLGVITVVVMMYIVKEPVRVRDVPAEVAIAILTQKMNL